MSRHFLRGAAAAATLLAIAGTVVAVPTASPTVVHPVGRLLSLQVTRAARGAQIEALEMQGYEMTEPIQIAVE